MTTVPGLVAGNLVVGELGAISGLDFKQNGGSFWADRQLRFVWEPFPQRKFWLADQRSFFFFRRLGHVEAPVNSPLGVAPTIPLPKCLPPLNPVDIEGSEMKIYALNTALRLVLMSSLVGGVGVFSGVATSATLTATDTGFVTPAGGSSKFDGLISPATFNYSVGWELICSLGGICPSPSFFAYGEKKNYFVFDLGSVAKPVAAASIFIDVPGAGYTSADSTEEFILSGTGVPLTDLDILKEPKTPGEITAGHIATAAAVFSGLTDEFDVFGSAFASAILGAADAGKTLELVLDGAGVAYINAAISSGGSVIFGGKLVSLAASSSGPAEEVFSFSDSTSPIVEMELKLVPLPAAGWFLVSALMALIPLTRARLAWGL